jgi:hypothetical protein
LLQSAKQFRDLHRARRKDYLRASLKIETGGRAIDAIADEIVVKLKLNKIAVRLEEGEAE